MQMEALFHTHSSKTFLPQPQSGRQLTCHLAEAAAAIAAEQITMATSFWLWLHAVVNKPDSSSTTCFCLLFIT